MTSVTDDIAWTRQLAIRLGPRAKSSMRWQMLKGIFRRFSSSANATETVQAFVDVAREEIENEGGRPPFAAESHLVTSLKVVLDANNVPSRVAEKFIRQIEEWERTAPSKSWSDDDSRPH
jgi:hypothetical protein